MPKIPGAIAQGVAVLHPAAGAPAQGGGSIPQNLHLVRNTQANQGLAAGPPQVPGTGAWRPWEASAPAWRPWEASTGRAPPALPVSTGVDIRRERGIDDLLERVCPGLLFAKHWVAGAGGIRGLSEFASHSGLARAPYQYADPSARQLTEHGRRMLDVWNAVFDLSQLGYGHAIPRREFEAFAHSREIDAKRLAHELGIARNRMSNGPVRFPSIEDSPERTEALASMRRIHAAAISNPPPEFLEHLHRVNPPLTAALQWINPASCRSTPLTCFSEQQGAGSKAHDYVRGMAGNAALSDRGITAFAGELAAFEWIQAGCPDRELRAIALANGVSTNHVRFYARQVFEILQAGVPFAPEWQRQAVA